MIEFKQVSKTFADGFEALKNIDLHVHKGELLTLIGPSGCGKTTTMKMINRLLEPSSGEILIDEQDIKNQNPVELRRNIGYVIQQIGLFPHMTIEENVALVPKLKGWSKDKYIKRVDELLELVGLEPHIFKKRYPSELSGGQQQRIGVIRALAAEPPVVLMDEPFSALDPISREQLQDELVALQNNIHKTIVFVTHDMDEALKIADRIAIMNHGEIIQLDTPDQILRHPANQFVEEFIGEERMNKELGGKTASSLMMSKVATVKDKRGLAEALKIMKSYTVDSLMVTNSDGVLEGVLELEILEDHFGDETKKVKDVMVPVTVSATTTTPYTEIAENFAKYDVKTVPVTEDGKLVGLITKSSMMRGLAGMKQNV
ncbi:ABC transporter ATP-binding protein [Pseudalkalibacillus berkeleyi]|uniref:Quaternary amine transport ATP-binding protein n=1 Tax=Pseudalkalibacillus berkeleyi TaxID=1069813 RepID=A0ABS9GX95_9BACL|nr:betaine/proline/choline family ABC transporter ATP-binding protein [Pseudalkalibacillus berkeleyi]MCF6136203.1 betaine/proline/choline family ABC transporter ATP-binding protein [Pseudalkalibacillus berkeleyi]